MDYYSSYYDKIYYDYLQTSPHQNLDPRLKSFNNDPLKFQETTNKNDDELWIETWLSKIGKIDINLDSTIEVKRNDKPKNPPSKCSMTISIAKTSLSRSLQIIDKLQGLQDHMKLNVSTITSIEWKKYTVEIGSLKDELLSLLSHFDNSNTLNRLQYNIKKRKKKRLNESKRKLSIKENIKKEHEESKRVNEAIDSWLVNMKESAEKAKEV